MMSEQPGNATPGTVASNGVKVVELTAFHVLIPLRKPFRHASHTRSSTDNIVVRCVLDDGTEGFGEGVPREYVTGETIEGSFEVLCRTDWAGQLEPCRDFAQATALAERLRLAPVAGDERGCMAHAARCAVELSLLDAWGRRFGESLSSVTRLLAPDLWQPRSRVRYSGAISSAQGLKLHLKSLLLRWYRFRHVKVKVGIAGLDDVSRLRVIRRYLNPRQVALRIDANEAWSAEDVVQRCR
ncbi:MAG: enolase C-terminal domain-like protein, partial [Gemmataceae bacterium]